MILLPEFNSASVEKSLVPLRAASRGMTLPALLSNVTSHEHCPKLSGTALAGETVIAPMVLNLESSDWIRFTSPSKPSGCVIAIVSRMIEYESPMVTE